MTAAELLADLHRQGFTLAPQGDGVRVAPLSRLPEDLRAAILAHKAGLLALLRPSAVLWTEADLDACCRAMEADQGLPAGSLRLYDPPRS
jgi:tubulysin polyketide synthase-like protein